MAELVPDDEIKLVDRAFDEIEAFAEKLNAGERATGRFAGLLFLLLYPARGRQDPADDPPGVPVFDTDFAFDDDAP